MEMELIYHITALSIFLGATLTLLVVGIITLANIESKKLKEKRLRCLCKDCRKKYKNIQ